MVEMISTNSYSWKFCKFTSKCLEKSLVDALETSSYSLRFHSVVIIANNRIIHFHKNTETKFNNNRYL